MRSGLIATAKHAASPHINVYHTNDGDKVIAFHRWDEVGDGVVVLVNVADQSWESATLGFLDQEHDGYGSTLTGLAIARTSLVN